jgi:hypothetical protein
VRKASVIPAAVLAAVFFFSVSSVAEAKRAHHRHASAKGGGSGRTETHKKKKTATHKPAPRRAEKSRPAASEERDGSLVLVDRVAVEIPQVYGPFLPLEPQDYPKPPCSGFDAVIEAHVHETDDETPEPRNVVAAVPREPVDPWTRVARTLGGLLHPKSAETTVRPEDIDLSDLLTAGVQIPVGGVDSGSLRDSFLASRGKHRQHLAIDIGAPKGTPVLAAADGQVVDLRREKRGGISLYQKDSSGRYLLFYCHLSRYAEGLRAGQKVTRGDLIGYVGRTGHVIGGAHLHFSITRLPEDDDNFKAGVAINPYLLLLAAVP